MIFLVQRDTYIEDEVIKKDQLDGKKKNSFAEISRRRRLERTVDAFPHEVNSPKMAA
jgi:hypothetical protein